MWRFNGGGNRRPTKHLNGTDMLSIRSIENAEDVLCCSSINLEPAEGTHVSALVNSLNSFNESGSNQELLDISVTGGAHSRTKEAIVKQIASIMRSTIDIATNVVNPLAEKCLLEIGVESDAAQLAYYNLLGSIKQISMPELFTDQMFQTLIEPCRNSLSNGVEKSKAVFKAIMDTFTAEELQLLILTGSEGVDRKAAGYTTGTSLNDIDSCCLDVVKTTLPETVLLFLLFNGLLNRPLDKCNVVLDQSDYLVIATKCKMLAGAKIYTQLAIYDGAIARGDIVALDDYGRGCCDDNRTTYVYGQNYLPWIKEQGGSPEALLGYKNANSDVSLYTMNHAIKQDPKKWADGYNRAYAHASSMGKVEQVRVIKMTTRRVIRDHIAKLENVDQNSLFLKLEKALTHDYYGEKDNYRYVISVICKTLTMGNTVKQLLLLVDDMLQNQSPGENNMTKAIYLAIKEVLAIWLADQVKVK